MRRTTTIKKMDEDCARIIEAILKRNDFEIKSQTHNFVCWKGYLDEKEVWMEEDTNKGVIDGIGCLGGMSLKTVDEINEALKVLHITQELK